MRDGPIGASYDHSESGWMEQKSFVNWFKKFIQHIEASPTSNKKILFFDGHVSHLSIELIDLANLNNIVLIRLPAHTTHLLQPLDVSVFKTVKDKWRVIVDDFLKSNNFKPITKSDFPKLMKSVVEQAFTRTCAVNGFEKTGPYPLNREIITPDKFIISEYYCSVILIFDSN